MTTCAPTPASHGSLRPAAPLLLLALALMPSTGLAQEAGNGSPQVTSVASGTIFAPHRSDPRAPSTYMATLGWTAPWLDTNVAAVGVADGFTLFRTVRGGVDVELSGDFAIHAQFDLDRPSFDFINADFIVSAPLTARRGSWSGSARFGHWSSHLGDEFLLRTETERQETSVEFIELLVARDVGPGRLLVGGERRLRIVPRTLPRNLLRVGGDLRTQVVSDSGPLGRLRLVAGTDLRLFAKNSRVSRPSGSSSSGMSLRSTFANNLRIICSRSTGGPLFSCVIVLAPRFRVT